MSRIQIDFYEFRDKVVNQNKLKEFIKKHNIKEIDIRLVDNKFIKLHYFITKFTKHIKLIDKLYYKVFFNKIMKLGKKRVYLRM